ncbi:hypothetical protein Har1130_07320 [Haloarcula sp. CBA1130]|uniref:hypothetical protein n=1 Tax=unclassified Haloarcula TaxID=2624677 RepID=UPI001244484B|nr:MULTISPECIES: hypothetical protein [unclassified Haloarcula]KAA9397409.1 hypothetical protein Har1129_03755 [Haloarcula sp. CBA1129]KAA9402558.1 hypothetical protein Har1130_07320 [Haloarcula sp. CBA1130]
MAGATRLTHETASGPGGRRDTAPVGQLCGCIATTGIEHAGRGAVVAYRCSTEHAVTDASGFEPTPTQTP